jgi:hypothetical protein
MDEVKIVVALKGKTALVGLQKPDCDPVFSRVEGDLAAVLASIPNLVEQARSQWESSPQYPKLATPLVPPPAPVRPVSTPPPKPKAQPAFF